VDVPNTTKKAPPRRKKTTKEERAAQRRPRFLSRQVSYVKHARRALRRLTKLANATHYDYTPDEAREIVKAVRDDFNRFEDAFVVVPHEPGLFDL
jgi:hypothetical protein